MPAVDAVVEIGPSAVRRVAPLPVVDADATMVAAALAGIDDPVVLFAERPVDVQLLWRRLIGSLVEPDGAHLTVVVPSWWSRRRVRRVVDAAATVAADVDAIPRSRLLTAGSDGEAVVIELADALVAVSTGDSIQLRARSCDPEALARIAIRAARGAARVVVDAPFGVAGADESARRILSALQKLGSRGVIVPISHLLPAPPDSGPIVARWSPFSPSVLAAALVAVVLGGLGLTMAHPGAPETPAPSTLSTDLVEGRITVRVPLRWSVTRVTAGPGSRRLQVTSTDDRGAALHITQSYVPGEELDATAEVLRRELDEEPPGVFTDFRPRDRRAGRAVVSYREIRGTRDISWVVLVDGATRIAIGCQSASGRADAVVDACDEAVRSAREVAGTGFGR